MEPLALVKKSQGQGTAGADLPPSSQRGFAARMEEWLGPLRDVASSSLPTRLLWVRGMDPWSHLKPNHVERVCQTVHAGVFSPNLSGRG